MAVTIDDPKKKALLNEWFCNSTSECSFSNEKDHPEITVKTEESAKALHLALVDFSETVNKDKKLRNGSAIPSPKLQNNTIVLSKQWIDNIDVTKERGHDIEKIYNEYTLLTMGMK